MGCRIGATYRSRLIGGRVRGVCRPNALIVGVVLQSCQALVWMVFGLLLGLDAGLGGGGLVRHGDPVVVVLVIAGSLVVAVGGFGLALAAGAVGSDGCRTASAVFQFVFGLLLLAARLAVPHVPDVVAAMPLGCLLIAVLLLLARTGTAETNGPDQGKSVPARVTAEYVQR
jgi:hypothetical protein